MNTPFARAITISLAAMLTVCASGMAEAEGRRTIALATGWHFHFGDAGDAPAQPSFDDSGWAGVTVPHSWNHLGNYGATRAADTDNRQGAGWYRLTVNAPPMAPHARAILDFGAVSKIADVWVNGVHIGQHRGGFARFRYDVTAQWHAGGANLITVRADNTKPVAGTPSGETLPLAGDFFVYGGLYRPVSLMITGAATIDPLDDGGPGIYAHTTSISADQAVVSVMTRLRNFGARRRALLTTTIRDATGAVVARKTRQVVMAGGASEANESLPVPHPHLWNGTADPYLYTITATLTARGHALDTVTQPLGIRSFRFDANAGFVLNGKPIALHGVSRHQDRPGTGWAISDADAVQDMALVKELGANAIRMAHYQHADAWVNEADRAGMAVWEEVPFVSTAGLNGGPGSPELWANAEQQLREMIRQQYNHPSIVMWSVGNEVDSGALFGIHGAAPQQPLPLLQHLNAVAHAEDPIRPTIFADCCEDVAMMGASKGAPPLAGTADMIGYNRYFGWYYPDPLMAGAELGAALDHFHAKHPALPMAISEYGAGGAISQHSDNVADGFLNFMGRPQPEEYESFVAEANWPAIAQRPFVFASFVWNLADFASDLREEGDSFDLNTKGLVTFDRKVKKDAFYYFKAQWSSAPFIWLTGKRYATRAYAAMDVKAYSNAAAASLRVNGAGVGQTHCTGGICLWPGVKLAPGANHVTATALASTREAISDAAVWTGPDVAAQGIHIAAGRLAAVRVGDALFGSDDYVTGGTPHALNMGGFGAHRSAPRAVAAPQPALYEYWREGAAFSYAIPVPDGDWLVTVHSFAPHPLAAPALMSITANGVAALAPLDVFAAAGGAMKGLARSFPVTVKGAVLRLNFAGAGGDAVVAAIEITRR